MVLVAKFKGADGSLGYKNGQDYQLLVEIDKNVMKNQVYITSFGDEKPCVYTNLRKFLDNWEVK